MSSDQGHHNADAWGLPGVVRFFSHERSVSADVYPSEWHFLQGLLREGISILDIGCAQGGFAGIISEHVRQFTYVGVDINADMIARGRARFPHHRFLCVEEGKFDLDGECFDVVLVLGILHLHETWRATLQTAWEHTRGSLVFDLRETESETIEDKNCSFLKMDFGASDRTHAETRLPYIILNTDEATRTAARICEGAASLESFGYAHSASPSAVTPYEKIITRVWCARR